MDSVLSDTKTSSCLVAWQLQLRGIKQWRVQMPLNKFAVRSWPEYAFADDLVGQDTSVQCGRIPLCMTLRFSLEIFSSGIHNGITIQPWSVTRTLSLVNHIPTDQIDRSSMFYDAFWASTRCNENIAGIYGNCWSLVVWKA